jgi:hypothetical protein
VKRKVTIGLLIALGLATFSVWVAKNTHWEEVEEHTPMKGAAAANPFYSAAQLARSLGGRTRLLDEIMSLPSQQAVMVVGFWNWDIIPERRERLQRWVRDGGRLVVVNNLQLNRELATWSGVTSLPLPDNVKNAVCGADQHCPTRRRAASTVSDKSLGEHFDVCNLAQLSYLSTARKISWKLQDAHGLAQILRVPIGRGTVTLLNALPFENTALLCGDDAMLFAAATELRRGEEIDFLTESRGGSLLGLLWTYGSPVIGLVALLLMLWLWRSGVRFGPLAAAPDPARRSLAEQIRGTGQFTLRFGGGRSLYTATVRALNEAAARRVPHYERLSGDERVAALASLTGLSSGELSAALGGPEALHPRDIRKTIATLEATRRHIATKTR